MARLNTVKGRQLLLASKAFDFRSAGSNNSWVIDTSRTFSNHHQRELGIFPVDRLIGEAPYAHAVKGLPGQQHAMGSHPRWIASGERTSSSVSCLSEHLRQEEGWSSSFRSVGKPEKVGVQGHPQAPEFRAALGTRGLWRGRGFHCSAAGLAAEEVAAEEAEEAALSAEGLTVTRTLNPQPLPPLSSLSFGRAYADHMLHAAWERGRGWGAPRVEPLGALPLHPCAQVLHYGMECFEGLKAYHGVDGRVRLFRPALNMARMQRSAARLALPAFSESAWLECLKALLRVDRAWVPREEGYALYLRPTLISTTPFLGVGPPSQALLFAVTSPVGPYFPTGLKPIALWAEQTRARACYGGVGDCKVGGNYAPTIAPLVEAQARGCQQVLFLHRTPRAAYIGECGAMNMFFLMRRAGSPRCQPRLELVTPPLDGLILPGVTRDSVLSLCRKWGEFQVSERHVTMQEVQRASDEGRLVEVFGTGTACMVQPVNCIRWEGAELRVPFDDAACAHWMARTPGTALEAEGAGEPLSLAGRLTRALLDIQHAHYPSAWSEPID